MKSKIVCNWTLTRNVLAVENGLNLEWAPEHEGIKAIGEADLPAKQGTKLRIIGPEPFSRLILKYGKKEIGNVEKKIK